MPKLSQRSYDMPASAIRKLVPYAEAAKKRGVKVYHLNIGQPDIKTPEHALDAIRNIDTKVIEYSHSAGIESYRRGLAKYYQNINIDVDYSDILVTAGGSEALYFAMMVAFNPGDEIIIPEPFYTNYNSFTMLAGVNVVPITSKIEDGFALPKIKDFEEKITDRTRGILICNPSNPTGGMYEEEELKQLRDFAIKHDLFIIADEVYREFVYDGRKHVSVMHLEGIEDRTILIDSTSKRYSECGSRMGCLVSKNKEFTKNALKFGQARLSPPYFGQILGEASLSTPKEYFEEVYNEYVERRNFLIAELNKIEGVYTPMPKGAFYTIAKLPIDDCDKFCQWMLEEFNYENQTVMMAPASGFYATKGSGKDQVRIAYVLKKEDLANAVKALEAGLKEYKRTQM
ncbi:MAG: pyridoxal phosphate-dependent aminotransferase [Bacteroidales bacterium]|nr:pyridoxal phosphate-dependent aminotransferase [Bacteroidales bacterium]